MSFALEDLKQLKTAIVHANCADGLTSALILKSAIPDIQIQFMQHGSKEFNELRPEKNMIFVDISPHYMMNLKGFLECGALVLDHHKSSKSIITAFGSKARFGDELTQPGVCGAVLAYNHVYKEICGENKAVERIANLAGIADTWQRESAMWKDAMIQLSTMNFYSKNILLDKNFLDLINSDEWQQMLRVGELYYNQFINKVNATIKSAYRFVSDKGTAVIAFEGISATSEAAEILGHNVDLVIGWSIFCEDNKPKVVFSTRSHTGFNCLQFAQRYDGGGHTKAAGFNRNICIDSKCSGINIIDEIKYLLHVYENALSF